MNNYLVRYAECLENHLGASTYRGRPTSIPEEKIKFFKAKNDKNALRWAKRFDKDYTRNIQLFRLEEVEAE